ncbi:MAG: hypothetical protein K8I82_31160 [Anaerolineae bacterium]|nr:hypothetical protein [Anaerolineae bacterium]
MKAGLVIGVGLMVLAGMVLMLMTIPASAQPGRRTPLAVTSVGRPTIDNTSAMATFNAAATSAVNSYGGVPQAASAALTSIPGQSNDAIAATGEFLATQAQEYAPGVYSTTTALPTQVPGFDFEDLARFSPEQQQLIVTFMEYGGISYDETTQTITMFARFSETAVNAVLDEAVASAGYDPNSVSADLVEGGTVITFYNTQQKGQTGTLMVTLEIEAQEGRVQVEILAATFQGQTIPLARLDRLTTELSTTFADRLSASFTANTELDYTIESLTLTETSAEVSVSISLN